MERRTGHRRGTTAAEAAEQGWGWTWALSRSGLLRLPHSGSLPPRPCLSHPPGFRFYALRMRPHDDAATNRNDSGGNTDPDAPWEPRPSSGVGSAGAAWTEGGASSFPRHGGWGSTGSTGS